MNVKNQQNLVMSLFIVLLCNMCLANKLATASVHYNIPDPDCTGPFGLCTQEDKDKLGYLAIKKLHEKMDDDRDGQVEIQETQEFMTEELQYKNGMHEREQKFHGSDSLISVDEMWKSWQHSQVYNWTTEDVITWLNEHVKLPQYGDYFRRNQIDGQFMPRLALNDNNYYTNVLQIRDSRHKRLLMVKSTDLVLFGQQLKPHNLIKDVLMIGALTLSIFFCIYLYSKHRQSLDQIRKLMNEFEKLTTATSPSDESYSKIKNSVASAANGQLRRLDSSSMDDSSRTYSSTLSLFNLKKKSELNLKLSRESQLSTDLVKNSSFIIKELNVAKIEAENLRKERENADGQQYKQLELAEKELEKVRAALRQTEARVEIMKYQPPVSLIGLLNRTYESEKELIDYKYKLIEKEKEACYDALKKISKRQSGLLGALKIAHSYNLEEINNKIEKLKRELARFKSEKQEWTKRWSNIDEICNRTDFHMTDSSSQDLPMTYHIERDELNKYVLAVSSPQADGLNMSNNGNSNYNNNNNSENGASMVNSPQIMNSVSTIYSKKSIYQAKSISSMHIPFDENRCNNIQPNNLRPIIDEEPKIEFDLNPANTDDDDSNKPINDKNKQPPNNPIISTGVSNEFQSSNSTNTTRSFVSYKPQPPTHKIARDSLIHKNDVFTFDDVESVHTHDSLFKQTPQSSFESDDTYKSSLNMDDLIMPKTTTKKSQNNNRLSNLITPILRTVNPSTSNTLHPPGPHHNGSFKLNGSANNKPLHPKSVSSSDNNARSATINNNNLKKSGTSSILENGPQQHPALNESVSSLDRKNTFSRHFSSLKRLISRTPVVVNSGSNLSTPSKSATSKKATRKTANNNVEDESTHFKPIINDEQQKSNSIDYLSKDTGSTSNSTSAEHSLDNNEAPPIIVVQKTPKKSNKLFKFKSNKNPKITKS